MNINRIIELRSILSRYKYYIVSIGGVLMVGLVGENSYLHSLQLGWQISDLKEEIELYNTQNRTAINKLRELERNPHAIEKIAREKYFMKADDEDIFVLSDDEPQIENKNEKNE